MARGLIIPELRHDPKTRFLQIWKKKDKQIIGQWKNHSSRANLVGFRFALRFDPVFLAIPVPRRLPLAQVRFVHDTDFCL